MSLPIVEDMLPEEEYLDDPIQLIPQTDNLTSFAEPEEFTAYKQKSYVPVTFFNIDRNIKLLNNCRPLCIKLVDCNQYPNYYKKLNKMYSYERNNLQTYDSDSTDDDDDVMYTADESETLSMEAKSILNKISSNGFTIKVKTAKTKKTNKIGINYQKNLGLIGMKITPTFEVIEIDEDSDGSRTDNIVQEKERPSDVSAEVNEKSTDNITSEFDWNIENSKKKESEVNLTVAITPGIEKTKATKDITMATHCDSSPEFEHDVDKEQKDDLGTTNEVNFYKQETTNLNPTANTIVENMKEGTLALQGRDNARKEGKYEEKLMSVVSCSVKEKSNVILTESTVKTNINNSKQISIHCDPIITDSETVLKKDNYSKSPVFPCTPPKKMKKFTNDRHDTSTLDIHHPKDFVDKKFKPNRLSSPKATSERLVEKVSFMQDNATKCIETIKSMPILNSTTDVEVQNQEQIMELNTNEKNIFGHNKNDENSCKEFQQGNTKELNLHGSPNQNKNDNDSTSKIGAGGKNNFQNKQCAGVVFKGQTSNKEHIIKLKLDENIYKDVTEKQLNNRKEDQKLNVVDVAFKAAPQANKTDHFKTSKVGFFDQNYVNNAKKPSNLHTIDTILDKSNPGNVSKIVPKNVHVYPKIGSAVLSEGKHNIPQTNSYNRPQVLSKSRIRPFTGSISNWQSMTNELVRTNNCSQSAAPVSKSLNLENSQLHHQLRFMPQNPVTIPPPNTQQNTAINNNTTNISTSSPIGQTDPKETPVRKDAIILARNGSNSLLNSCNVSRNYVHRNAMQNIDPIAEQKRAHLSQNGISRNYPQNCCIPSFGPQHRQFVRPIMRQDGTQVLSVTNYPKQMYSNTMNTNTVSVNPYVGYNNNFNPYWPYYTSMSPPPINSNISQVYGKVNAPDNNKVNVIKQIQILASPVSENLQKNNVPERPNLIDINLNNTNPSKSLTSSVINNEQNVVSSKIEMFEELEKEMMNIHHEDSENFINNQLCDRVDSKPIDKHNNITSDPRIKPILNATETTTAQSLKNTAPIQSTNKGNTIFTKPLRPDHDSTKKSRNTVYSLKRPSDKLTSPNIIKKKKNVPTRTKLNKNNSAFSDSPAPGYSPPILPIPSYKQTLDILTRANNDAQKRLEAFEKSCKQLHTKEDKTKFGNTKIKKDKVKKISLDEYKKREDKRVCEKMKRKYERNKKDGTVHKCVDAKHSDQDQGYDSDSTILL